jgi:hypothetical protein
VAALLKCVGVTCSRINLAELINKLEVIEAPLNVTPTRLEIQEDIANSKTHNALYGQQPLFINRGFDLHSKLIN